MKAVLQAFQAVAAVTMVLSTILVTMVSGGRLRKMIPNTYGTEQWYTIILVFSAIITAGITAAAFGASGINLPDN